jgi:type IV pilus assembly protein PilC
VKGEVEANTENSVAKILLEKGLSPLEINSKEEQTGGFAFFGRVPVKEKVIFSRQLSTLINSGLPLLQSLQAVQKQTSNARLKDVIRKVMADVEAGTNLADSLARYPAVFNDVYISLIAAGETSGTLDVSLERLANQQEKDAEIVSKVRGAMIYPVIVIFVLIAVVIFMMVAVLPPVQSLYAQLPGAKLPILTRALLVVSHSLIHYWWIMIIVLGAAVFISTRWARTVGGRSVIDGLKMKMWPVGPLFMKLYMARFARTGGTLVTSGVPMIKMLNTTSKAIGNVHVEASINRATEKVKGGKSLAESLKDEPNFLDLVPSMISIGEQSGALDTMLNKVADYYEKEVDNQIKSVSTIIEPALMVVVGVMALIIVAAVLLPIYSLAGHSFTR